MTIRRLLVAAVLMTVPARRAPKPLPCSGGTKRRARRVTIGRSQAMADEGFHEIQLTGKQLVFLFMALTIGAVVAFLAGVMVGRDLPARAGAVEAAEGEGDPTAAEVPAPTSTVTSTDTPIAAEETLTYAERLEAPLPPPETFREPVEAAPPPAVPAIASEARASTTASRSPAGGAEIAADLSEPPGRGWAVQVTAVKRPEAEAIARRLKEKGYAAFVTARPNGLFAVRIGKFDNLGAAEDTATRLRKEEQFHPWVTR
jgi:cell division septation protein DedD